MRQQVLARHHKRAKGTPKSSTIAVYASIFVFIVALIAVGYNAPQQVAGTLNSSGSSSDSSNNSVDQVVAANIAANAAVANDLSVKAEVLNTAVSIQLQQEYSLLNEDTAIKPQIFAATSDIRKITNYKVKSGDNIDSIASSFGISKETIKWVNNLTSDNISAGKVLKVLPVDGVLYTVKSGDTISSIADKYKVNTARLVLYNDLDISGLVAGKEIILPNATLPNNERPGYVTPVTYLNYTSGYNSSNTNVVSIYKYLPGGYRESIGNSMVNGQCTWYAWERRKQIGRPLPMGSLGNAKFWAGSLHSRGYRVDLSPKVGAIIQEGSPLTRGYGHVGIVEHIFEDGSLLVSDMNYIYDPTRKGIVTERIIPKSATGGFNYIH